MCGPKFCSYKITQSIMDNPEMIAQIAEDARIAEEIRQEKLKVAI
jgi:phosphomethylpyrimidine synthase